jgi:hypothetical protein
MSSCEPVTLVGLNIDITSDIFAVVGNAFGTLELTRPLTPSGESIAIGVEDILKVIGLFT